MNRKFYRITGVVLAVVALAAGGFYLARNPDAERFLRQRKAEQVLRDYADNMTLKTLSLLVDDLQRLDHEVTTLAAVSVKGDAKDQSYVAKDAAMETAAAAWDAAYRRYLQTTAFWYGPASYYDYDKRLGTWPVDRVLLEHAVNEMASGRLHLDARLLREEKPSSMRGFHAVQYLLFRNGRLRRAGELVPAELVYLQAAARALLEEGVDFEASWRGTENLSPSKVALLDAAGIPRRSPYAEEFRKPGTVGSRYTSLSIPLQEIFQEISGTVEDLLPDIDALRELPADGAPRYWESRDACGDLLDRLRSAENAYLGGVEGFRGHSVSELAAGYSGVSDRRVKIAFAHAAHRIAAIRDFAGRDADERDLAVRVAKAECDKLIARLALVAQQVVMEPAFDPWRIYGK
ncbi:MAG: Imelysin [Acidobacteriota bacterium]|nr:Imelysin [Acidobacteriota bacterium]